MKGKFVWVAAAAAALVLVSPGFSPAGDQAARSASPEFGTWEYWMAEETGTLPSPGSDVRSTEESGTTALANIGTWEYWMAEETGSLPGSEPGGNPSRTDVARGAADPGPDYAAWESDWRTINLEP